MERSRLALSLTMLSSSWRPASTPSSSWPPASSRLPSSPLDGLMLNTRTTNQNKDFLGGIPFWGFHFLGGGSILGGVPFLGGFHLMFSCTSLEGANASWFVWYKISKFKIYRNGYSSIIAHLALQTMCLGLNSGILPYFELHSKSLDTYVGNITIVQELYIFKVLKRIIIETKNCNKTKNKNNNQNPFYWETFKHKNCRA